MKRRRLVSRATFATLATLATFASVACEKKQAQEAAQILSMVKDPNLDVSVHATPVPTATAATDAKHASPASIATTATVTSDANPATPAAVPTPAVTQALTPPRPGLVYDGCACKCPQTAPRTENWSLQACQDAARAAHCTYAPRWKPQKP